MQLGAQVPDAHAVVPWAFVHARPQAPQSVLVRSATSHPFAELPSQLPKLALQVIAQVPPEQLAAPLLLLQAFPQDPQFATFVSVLTSQPFPGWPSQLPKPAEQVPRVHVRDEQDSVAFARSHTAPQAPQSPRVPRLASHPLAATPSQSPEPALHARSEHVPLKHVAEAFA